MGSPTSNQRSFVFGADGGGTKTKGVIARGDGEIIVQRVAGPTNQNIVGVDGAARELAGLLVSCCNEAGIHLNDLHAAVFGLAGAGEDAERKKLVEAINQVLRQFGYGVVPVRIVSDARIALEGAFGGEPGVIVIAGTGSVVMGKRSTGKVLLVGGWGRVLGDEGSGYRIGLEAIRAVTRAFDSRSSAGSLRDDLRKHFGWETRQEIINAVYRQRFDIASIAPVVLAAADRGDQIATEILRNAAGELAVQVSSAIQGLQFPSGPVPVAFCGSLIDHQTYYAKALEEAIVRLAPSVRVQPALHPAVNGAVLLARTPSADD